MIRLYIYIYINICIAYINNEYIQYLCINTKVCVWAKTPERGLFCKASFCSSRETGLAMWCSLILWNTDTTNDIKSEWWAVDAKLCLLLKSNALPIWAGMCCTVLWHPVSSAAMQQEYDLSKKAAAFLAPSSLCGVYSSLCLWVNHFKCLYFREKKRGHLY